MLKIEKVLSSIVFSLLSLLTILLVFEKYVVAPVWLQTFGRMHPLVLHFPIAFVVLLVLLDAFKSSLDGASYRKINRSLLWLTVLSSTMAVLMGFFLYREGYDSESMTWHKWTGISLAYIIYLLLWFDSGKVVYRGFLYLSLLMIAVAGHFGANLTHGSNFLTEPMMSGTEPVVDENTTLFTAVIQPILKSKCESCHNPEKHKGDLDLSSIAGINKGGENGPLWKAGDVLGSAIIHRALLPVAHEDHMPPEGKVQLTELEVSLLKEWIARGADTEISLAEIPKDDSLHFLVFETLGAGKTSGDKYGFPFADKDLIQKLNIPYRNVIQKSPFSPAIEATIFGRQSFQMEYLKELSSIKKQIVELNLSYLPIDKEALGYVAEFANLERLNLNFTDVQNEDLEALLPCENLHSLSLSGTSVTTNIKEILKKMPKIEEVYLWNTPISKAELGKLEKELPELSFEIGYLASDDEALKLTPPILSSEKSILRKGEEIMLSHKLKGVQIRFTTDGSEPDSSSKKYSSPLKFDTSLVVKAFSFKKDWVPSDVKTFEFYKRGFVPKEVRLLQQPSQKYKAKGGASLTDDKKGEKDDLLSNAWLGYQDNPFEAMVDFGNQPPALKEIVFSYGIDKVQWIAPPQSIELWGGDSQESLRLLEKKEIAYPEDSPQKAVKLIRFQLPEESFSFYKIIANPIPKLPYWHQAKGKKGWVFIDQLFFY